jgi:hypothetical protein
MDDLENNKAGFSVTQTTCGTVCITLVILNLRSLLNQAILEDQF